MEQIWRFLRVLVLSGGFVVHGPADLAPGAHDFSLPEPAAAITPGASVMIDVTRMVPPETPKDLLALRDWAASTFEGRRIEAVLSNDADARIFLTYRGHVSVGDDSIWLELSSDEPLPLDVAFDRLVLTTDVALRDVVIRWSNARL